VENRIGFGKRLGAFLIDAVLCGILAFFGGGVIGGMLGATAGTAATMTLPATGDQMSGMIGGAVAGALVGFFVIAIVYNLLEGFTGWTLGKLMLGIQIGNQDGTRASTGQLLLRWALKNSNSILAILSVLTGVAILNTLGRLAGVGILVGYFFVLATSKQGFHDMIAKTAVYPRKQLQGS